MEQGVAKAVKKYVRISPRKIARIGRELVNQELKFVKPKLKMMPQHAARQLYKTIVSAEANFQVKNPNFNTDDLWLTELLVNKGPTMRRMKPRARGSADVILKRSSHIVVKVSSEKKNDKKKQTKQKVQGTVENQDETLTKNDSNVNEKE